MNTFAMALLALLPKIGVNIAAKIFAEEAMQKYLERVIIYALEKLTPLTTNTLDDEIAAQIIERLKR